MRIDRRSLLIGLVLIAATACSSSSESSTTTSTEATATSTTEAASRADIIIDGFTFDPSTFTVSVGDTVTWENVQGVGHTTTADGGEWNSGSLSTGGTFSHTFETAGSFTYFCQIHPAMEGTIEVQG